MMIVIICLDADGGHDEMARELGSGVFGKRVREQMAWEDGRRRHGGRWIRRRRPLPSPPPLTFSMVRNSQDDVSIADYNLLSLTSG